MPASRITRHLSARKLIALKRLAMAHCLSGILPIYIVNEFPKSGGTWLSRMLASALDLPFEDNVDPPVRASVMKGHFLRPGGLKNTVIVWRDGRDVMVSLYHHCYFKFEDRPYNHGLVDLMRHTHPFDDYEAVAENLPAFIEQQFARPMTPLFTWTRFVDVWAGRRGAVHTSYEALRRDPVAELGRIVEGLTGEPGEPEAIAAAVDRHSFARQKAAAGDARRSFVRKGSVGDWKNLFSPELSRRFEELAGGALDALGYARDERLRPGAPDG